MICVYVYAIKGDDYARAEVYRAQNNYEMLIKTIHVLIVMDDNNTCPYAKNQIYQILPSTTMLQNMRV